MGLWKSFVEVLYPIKDDLKAPDAGYEPINSGEDGSPDRRGVTGSHDGIRHLDDSAGVYWCFWSLGAGVLLSWNVLICTIPLLGSFFEESSNVRASLASVLSTTYCFGNLFFLGLSQRNVSSTSPSPRLHSSLVLLFVTALLLTFPFLPIVLPALSPSSPLLLPLMIIVTILLAISTAYLQSAVFALAALWGSKQTLAVMSGQGGIAVLVSGAQVILAIVSALGSSAQDGRDDAQSGQSLLAGVGLWAIGCVGAFGCMVAHRYLIRHPDYSLALAPIIARKEHKQNGLANDSSLTMSVFKKNLALEGAVAWVFVVTLAVFPPVTTAILSVRPNPPLWLQPVIFIPLHFLIFNIGDYAGRTYLPAIPALLITSPRKILLLSLFRTTFIPILLACNVNPQPGTSPLINSDTIYFLILLSIGLTNGYVSSLSMIVVSSPELNPRINDEEKDLSGTLAAFCLVAGLAGGSVLSFGVNILVRGNSLG